MGSLEPGDITSAVPLQTHGESEGATHSEWEYEYDPNETEDFYFTLDLTTHVPDAQNSKESSRNGKVNGRGKQVAEHAALDSRSSATPGRQFTSDAIENGELEDSNERSKTGKLQFLNLHTREPLIRLDDGVYSCYWMTDLGTQFYVSRPGVAENPLRPGNVLDVIGISQVRLIGKPVTLTPLGEEGGKDSEGTLKTSAINVEDVGLDSQRPAPTPSDFSTLRPGQPIIIPRDRIKDEAMGAQASFLERLSAVKLKKGENDIIPVGGVRIYDAPANRDEIREKALAAEAEQLREEEEARQFEQAQQPPKRRKRRANAEPKKPAGAEQPRRVYPRSQGFKLPMPMPPPTLPLPRSQSSISATMSPWTVSAPMQMPPSTVQYDTPSGTTSSFGDNVTMPIPHRGASNIGPEELVESRHTMASHNEFIDTATTPNRQPPTNFTPAHEDSPRPTDNGVEG